MDQELILELNQKIHLPANYTRPKFFSRPDSDFLEKVMKTIPLEIENCDDTLDFAHPTNPGDRTVVALRLGSVDDSSDLDEAQNKLNGAQKHVGQFVVACRDRPELLHFVE